jgi:hypothetical protein
MTVECVIVCVDYADFLVQTLPHNIQHFDRVLVVTSFNDRATQSVCRRLSVECRPTDVMYRDGEPFAKGRAIDYGLGYLQRCDWMVQLDADIWLPPTTRNCLNWIPLDDDCIYGIDRVNCVGYDKWARFMSNAPEKNLSPGGKPPRGLSSKAMDRLQHRYHCMIQPPGLGGENFPLGTRIALREHGGYVPIGFFQLWHTRHQRRYPLLQGSAEHTDVLHALQWPAGKRRLIPEIIGIHLSSEPGPMGANWSGRTSRRFGPVADVAAESSRESGYQAP